MQKLFFTILLLISCSQVIAQTCKGSVGDNIFPDGNFGFGDANIFRGNANLAPGYVYAAAPPPNDGAYCITNNTTPWGGFAAIDWINIGDNSGDPRGYMMVVNASYEPGLFYEKTVPVCGNTNYEFSADVISMNDPRLGASRFIAPNISFLINDTVAVSSGDVPIDARWHTYGFTFTTPMNASDIKLSLRNNAPGGFGNDLALDNILFRPCGPTIAIIDSIEICSVRPTSINSTLTGEAFASPVFQWQRSVDDGNTWTDIAGANNRILNIQTPADGEFYRLAVASSTFTLSQKNCRVVSNVSRIRIQPLRDTFQFVVCQRDTLRLANLQFYQNGSTNIPLRTAAGCDSIATVIIKIEDLSDFKIQGDSIICKGTTDTLKAGNFAKYQWSTGATTPSLNITNADNYAVTVTSVNGCIGMDNVQVDVSEVSDFSTELEPPICSDGKDGHIRIFDVIGDSPPYFYTINAQPLQNIEQFDSLRAGNYKIIVQNVNGCRREENVTITAPPAFTVELGEDIKIELGDSIFLSAITNLPTVLYKWQPPLDTSCINCSTLLVRPLRKTSYTLHTFTALGCKAADSIIISVQNLERIYAPNAFSPNNDGANDIFTIFTGKGVQNVMNLQIFDRWGNQLFNETSPGELKWNGIFNNNIAPQGVYVWTATVQFIDETIKLYHGEVTLIR